MACLSITKKILYALSDIIRVRLILADFSKKTFRKRREKALCSANTPQSEELRCENI